MDDEAEEMPSRAGGGCTDVEYADDDGILEDIVVVDTMKNDGRRQRTMGVGDSEQGFPYTRDVPIRVSVPANQI